MNFRTIPWHLTADLIKHEKNKDSYSKSYIGNSRIIYSSKNIPIGRAIIVPLKSVDWHIVNKSELPIISILEKNTGQTKEILKSNPGMDISQKVLVDAKEIGTMELKEKKDQILYIQFDDIFNEDE